MNGLLTFAVMAALFVGVVYGAHRVVRALRNRGHGAKLDALYRATVRGQGHVLVVVSKALSRSRVVPRRQRPPDWPDPPDDSTKRD